jgi:hypothetical protein
VAPNRDKSPYGDRAVSTDTPYMADPIPADELHDMSLIEPLTREEDDELIRLSFLAQHGILSDRKRERMLELRLRDRRARIRSPRTFD